MALTLTLTLSVSLFPCLLFTVPRLDHRSSQAMDEVNTILSICTVDLYPVHRLRLR